MNDIKEDINKRMNKTDEFMDKYNHPGVYVIYIDGVIAYIGQSMDMSKRISQHLGHIKHPEAAELSVRHRYNIFKEAYNTGHTITFDVICYVNEFEPLRLQKKLLAKEIGFLTKYLPPLNYYINRNLKNPGAFKISLRDILQMERKQIKSAYAAAD